MIAFNSKLEWIMNVRSLAVWTSFESPGMVI